MTYGYIDIDKVVGLRFEEQTLKVTLSFRGLAEKNDQTYVLEDVYREIHLLIEE